jgi:hypothetical protein
MDDNSFDRADGLVRLLIQHQPHLFQPVPATPNRGQDLAETIEALRNGLAEMYKKKP